MIEVKEEKKMKRRRYTDEQREEITKNIETLLEQGMTVDAAVKQAGVGKSFFYKKRVQKFKKRGRPPLAGKYEKTKYKKKIQLLEFPAESIPQIISSAPKQVMFPMILVRAQDIKHFCSVLYGDV